MPGNIIRGNTHMYIFWHGPLAATSDISLFRKLFLYNETNKLLGVHAEWLLTLGKRKKVFLRPLDFGITLLIPGVNNNFGIVPSGIIASLYNYIYNLRIK